MKHIETLLPHRPPFRFVDALVEIAGESACFALRLEPGDTRIRAARLPALLLVEALAQAAAAFHGAMASQPEAGWLVEVSSARLLRDAHVGDHVALTIERQRQLGNLVRFAGRAEVSGRLLAEALITVARAPEGQA